MQAPALAWPLHSRDKRELRSFFVSCEPGLKVAFEPPPPPDFLDFFLVDALIGGFRISSAWACTELVEKKQTATPQTSSFKQSMCIFAFNLTLHYWSFGSPYAASSGGVSTGMRKPSLAQAPKSIFLQRSLQKGLKALLGA